MNDFELAFGVTLFKRLSKGMAGAGMGLRSLDHFRAAEEPAGPAANS